VGVTALVASVLSALVLGAPLEDSARYLESRQAPGGCFAEPGGQPTAGLTAWAVLGLRAAGRHARGLEGARACLVRTEGELASATDVELVVLARAALGDRPAALLARLDALRRPSGAIGPTLNATIWGILALRQAGRPAPPASVRYLLRHQTRAGGWSWSVRAEPDSNDTAAALQALRAAGVTGRAVERGIAFLRRFRNRDGGFELTDGRGSDVQSTAWAIQAYLATGRRAPEGARAYLTRMRRADGSFRYSARYVATPVWVTSHALAALAGKPLPLRTGP
jgi:hypothetical protein